MSWFYPSADSTEVNRYVTYNYVVTAQKPTAVTHAIRGRFTSKDELNLIVAKGTLLELSKITEEGLQPILEIPLEID